MIVSLILSVEAPSITVSLTSVTFTTIPLTWTSAGSVVNNYEIVWTYDGECSDVRGGRATVAGDMTSYTIGGLEEYITYSITVTAANNVGNAVSEVATVRTSEAGEVISQVTIVHVLHVLCCTLCSSFWSSHFS